MNAIIFGVGGQDGQYLGSLLKEQGLDLIGVDRSGSYPKVDLSDLATVSALIKETQPDYIFHFAANSTTRHDAWQHNHDTISSGTLNILDCVHQHSIHTKIFLSGSGLQFVNTGSPIKETDPFEPSSMYAVSRIHSTYAARYYRKLGVLAYVGYFFNHDSPLRTERHINKLISSTVNRIASGSDEILEIGDLSVKKEFGFAGDIVKAAWIMVNQEQIFEATIGTGEAYSIEEWIACCFQLKGLDWKKHVRQKIGYKPDYKTLVSDPTTIFQLGWTPTVSMKALAMMMLENK
jgi:GDPmannose 4,6-dehydratase